MHLSAHFFQSLLPLSNTCVSKIFKAEFTYCMPPHYWFKNMRSLCSTSWKTLEYTMLPTSGLANQTRRAFIVFKSCCTFCLSVLARVLQRSEPMGYIDRDLDKRQKYIFILKNWPCNCGGGQAPYLQGKGAGWSFGQYFYVSVFLRLNSYFRKPQSLKAFRWLAESHPPDGGLSPSLKVYWFKC